MKNTGKFYTASILRNLFLMMTTGSVLQTFLLEKDFSEHSIGIYFSVINILQIITILVFSLFADKLKQLVKATVRFHLLEMPFAIFLIVICFLGKLSVVSLILFLLFTFLFNIGIGIYNVLSYKLPYKILDLKNYGSILSVSGILSGVLTFVLSTLLSFFQSRNNYITVMKISFTFTLIVYICYLIAVASYKETEIDLSAKVLPEKNFRLLKYKPFTILIPANLLRGFCAGAIGMAITIGYYNDCLDSGSASVLVVITNITTFLGCTVYSKISSKLHDRLTILISSFAIVLFLPAMLIFKSTAAFLIFYGITYFFVVHINYAVPVAVTRLVPYEIAGKYNAGRMLLNTLGTSLASSLCIPMFDIIGAVPTLIICAVMQLASGIMYYSVLKAERLK